ncbi:MAG: Hpt domain-containing protein, partial [Mariprofundaceae bacterium]
MDEELLGEFLTESNENLASIEDQLTELEANPDDEELVNAIFRVIHTVKGSCGFLGLGGLEKVAHAGENLLGRIRSQKFPVTPELVSLLLECADAINAFLEGLESDGVEPELDHSALITRLQAAERLVQSMSSETDAHTTEEDIAANDSPGTAEEVQLVQETRQSDEGSGAADADASQVVSDVDIRDWASDFGDGICGMLAAAGLHAPEQVISAGFSHVRSLEGLDPADALKILGLAKVVVAKGGVKKEAEEIEAGKVPESGEGDEANTDGEKPSLSSPRQQVQKGADDTQSVVGMDVTQSKAQKESASSTGKTVCSRNDQLPGTAESTGKTTKLVQSHKPALTRPKSAASIRVDVELLDSLMNQVGELVLTRNRLIQMVQETGSMELMRVGREVDHVTERLQSQLLQTRMQPIKTIWNGVPRVVRDMSKQLNKKIRVLMDGEETELDRNILNAL